MQSLFVRNAGDVAAGETSDPGLDSEDELMDGKRVIVMLVK